MSAWHRDVRDYPNLEVRDLSAAHPCFGNPGGAIDSDLMGIPQVFCPECCAHAEIDANGVCEHCETMIPSTEGRGVM